MKFNVGDYVICGDDEGFITFVDHAYFTLCVRQWDDPDKLHGYSRCTMLIYRNDWTKCTITGKVDPSQASSNDEGTQLSLF